MYFFYTSLEIFRTILKGWDILGFLQFFSRSPYPTSLRTALSPQTCHVNWCGKQKHKITKNPSHLISGEQMKKYTLEIARLERLQCCNKIKDFTKIVEEDKKKVYF